MYVDVYMCVCICTIKTMWDVYICCMKVVVTWPTTLSSEETNPRVTSAFKRIFGPAPQMFRAPSEPFWALLTHICVTKV